MVVTMVLIYDQQYNANYCTHQKDNAGPSSHPISIRPHPNDISHEHYSNAPLMLLVGFLQSFYLNGLGLHILHLPYITVTFDKSAPMPLRAA
jgi:hypothetical protein